MKTLRLPVCLAALALGWAAGLSATACDTPVYRFAMYSKKWAPWPYVVAYLYSGEKAEEDAEVNAKLRKLVEDQGEFTNIRLEPFDVTQQETFEALPREVQEAWRNRKEKDQPLHVVTNPTGAVIWSGRLKTDDIGPMIDSPARQKAAKLLAGGKIVFALLEKPGEESSAAEKTVLEVARMARDGEIEAAPGADLLSPADLVPKAEPDVKSQGDNTSEKAKPKEAPKLEVALLKISPSDPKETWLVRMLMRADPEPLGDVAGKPMVFALYGQGRAMPPYIDKGITKDNLIGLDGINFLSGPCSCEVKEQNPGVDLLMTNDWTAAAEQMARIFGEEEGNEGLLDVTGLVPSLGVGEGAGEKPAVTDPGKPAASTSQPTAAPTTTRGVGNRMARYIGIGVGCVLLLLLLGSLPFLGRGS